MPYQPKDGISAPVAKALRRGGHIRSPQQLFTPSSGPYYSSAGDLSRRYANWGSICAIASLFIFPEIFGSMTIILGGYAWKLEPSNSNHGRNIMILGIICMLMGLYFTSFFALYDLIPY